jgi:thioredoxin-like negative regulator of GroEL
MDIHMKSRLQRFGVVACVLLCMAMLLAPVFAAPSAFDEAVQQYRSGKFSQALTQFQSLEKGGRPDPYVHYYMGLCFHNLNQVSRAQQEYQWVMSSTNNAALRRNAELGLQSLGKYAGSRNYQGQGATPTASSPARISSSGSGGRPQMLDFRGRVEFKRIDIDEQDDLANKFQVKAVPTFVFIDGRGTVVHRVQGANPQGVEEGLQKLTQ